MGVLHILSLHLLLTAPIVCDYGDDYNITKLPCQAQLELGLRYRKVSWYKVDGGLTGLALKNLYTNNTILYKYANHSYRIGADLSLFLPASALNDCGRYRCTLWPPVGHQIREGDYSFYPAGCPKAVEPVLTEPQPSRVSSSNPEDNAMMVGMAAAVITTLVITTVTVWIRRSRDGKNYKSILM